MKGAWMIWLAAGLVIGSLSAQPALAQQAVRMYGLLSGGTTAQAVAVSSTGSVQVLGQ